MRLPLALPACKQLVRHLIRHTYSFPGALDAARTMVRSEGALSLYRGLAPTLVGIAPYAALNFASYDLIKKQIYHGEK